MQIVLNIVFIYLSLFSEVFLVCIFSSSFKDLQEACEASLGSGVIINWNLKESWRKKSLQRCKQSNELYLVPIFVEDIAYWQIQCGFLEWTEMKYAFAVFKTKCGVIFICRLF